MKRPVGRPPKYNEATLETKTCTRCEIKKRLDDFQKDRRYRSGRHSWCWDCKRTQTNQYNHNKALAAKGYCARPGCTNRIPLRRQLYCGPECAALVYESQVKAQWQKQKQDPNYKEYHRIKALESYHRRKKLKPRRTNNV